MFETGDGPAGDRHRILIVGGGVAGIDLAGSLAADRRYDVALVDAATTHVWKPMLHSIAAGTRTVALEGVPFMAQAARRGFAYHPGRASGVDRAARLVTVEPFRLGDRIVTGRRHLAYDTLVLAVGSVAHHFDVPGVGDHARHIDTLAQAHAFQAALVPALAAAVHGGERLAIAIVGGGATGTQLAAELVQMADTIDDYGVAGARAALSVTLVEKGDRLLPPFPPAVSQAVGEKLARLGVDVRLDVDVVAADADGYALADGGRIPADFAVWAAGVKAAPLIAALDGLETGPADRLVVDDRLRTADPRIFALGDCAALTPEGADGPLPPTAQIACQQAVWLARALPRMLAGEAVARFSASDRGALVALGDYEAFGALGDVGLFPRGFVRGRIAQLGHRLLYRRHQMRLLGVRRGLLLWLSDRLAAQARPAERIA